MDLNTAANLAEIIGVLIVVGGLAFAVIQVMQFRQHRRDMAAIELARSFEKPAFGHALRLVLSLPDGITAKELRAKGTEYEDAAMLVSLTLESVAIMVHRRIVSFDLVWELMGGVVQTTWGKLGTWAQAVRDEQEQQKFDEWIQWLAKQMKRYGDETGLEPAHHQYKNWRP
ncbi:MAG: hypothetical protein AMS21_09810 [Gemmatimonas sp. SG8_38_2]|nr:MAG: hypothetical protein AMS21_09810 [Gemmatimonas sp. SG8_38_2]